MTAGSDRVRRLGKRADRQATLDELFRAKDVKPIQTADDLACEGVFDSDEELEEFLAYTYAARRADLA